MSRAFIRDPEPEEPRCPACRAIGEPVGSRTVDLQVSGPIRARIAGAAYFCPTPGCPTAYFDGWGAVIPVDQLKDVNYPKSPEGPICPCFGVAPAEIIHDAREGRKDRVRGLLERAQGPEAKCAERCLDGRSCVPRIMRLFREVYEAR